MATHEFTRQELYDLVWSIPMAKLAERYGISGNGLAKACRKAEIPVPERGYWAKLQAGKKAVRKALPAVKRDTPRTVIISPPGKREDSTPPPPVPDSVAAKVEQVKQTAKPVSVPATLSNPHRIVAAWLEDERREKRARRGDPLRQPPRRFVRMPNAVVQNAQHVTATWLRQHEAIPNHHPDPVVILDGHAPKHRAVA